MNVVHYVLHFKKIFREDTSMNKPTISTLLAYTHITSTPPHASKGIFGFSIKQPLQHIASFWVLPYCFLALSGCGGTSSTAVPPSNLQTNNTPTTITQPPEIITEPPEIITHVTVGSFCDNTQPSHCLYPFPNNFFTANDNQSKTGKRVNIHPDAMPTNESGVTISNTNYNRNDGFSPAAMLIAHIPNLDLDQTGAVPLTDLARYLDDNAPILVIDADSGERQMIWAELDENIEPNEAQALIIRPAKNLTDGHRYIVALRRLKDSNGSTIEANANFKIYRDGLPATIDAPESRRSKFNNIFTLLSDHGVSTSDLTLAWDFTVASTENITGRVLHMRDEGMAMLDGNAPDYTLTDIITPTKTVDEGEEASTEPHPDLSKIIKGTLSVPNYLNQEVDAPGAILNYSSTDLDALPTLFSPDAKLDVPFTCAIPHSALEKQANAAVIAHGLFGSQEMVSDFGSLANEGNLVLSGMDWSVMSDADVAYTVSVLADMSLFSTIPDRLQQSYLNIIYLTEAMTNIAGFVANENFQLNGNAVFDPTEISFDGISQGSVLGGGLLAISPHFKRGMLNVAGKNFSLLMRRSNAWPTYSIFMYPEYPNTLDRNVIFSMIQMLWDRGETNGYANHITSDPLPGSFTKKVLIHGAVGDKTVSENSLENLARTLEVKLKIPAIVSGRHIAVEPYYGIEEIEITSESSFDGSALVMWDSGPLPIDNHDGVPLRPIGNIADEQGHNAHTMPFSETAARQQKAAFMRKDGSIIDVCDGAPCYGDGYDGTPGIYNPEDAP